MSKPIPHAPEMLKAVNELITRYEALEPCTPPDTIVLDNGCPLCPVFSCRECPWVLFEGSKCLDLSYEERPVSERLERLYRWRKKIEAAL